MALIAASFAQEINDAVQLEGRGYLGYGRPFYGGYGGYGGLGTLITYTNGKEGNYPFGPITMVNVSTNTELTYNSFYVGSFLSTGLYGGAGGAGANLHPSTGDFYPGAPGAVRIIWGAGRAFPNTNINDI